MFGSKKSGTRGGSVSSQGTGGLVVCAPPAYAQDPALRSALEQAVTPIEVQVCESEKDAESRLKHSKALLALFQSVETLTRLNQQINKQRAGREDGSPVLIIVIAPTQLTEFGEWLANCAHEDAVRGIRLIVANQPEDIAQGLADKLAPITETNIIAMPISTEVETAVYKYFYCISPELRQLLAYLEDLARNNISRIYLLGGPGAGKTSLAYYFYLCRRQGNFVTVNLTSEATDDKAAMKSLLCGHVAGAFPGAGSRTGAFSHARDGVAFLDESHGVSGSVMEVLMEALDSSQYLPYGASAKRPLECAVVFASNRTWDTLISSINIDEHARLGAMIMHLPDLAVRIEDLIAVLATTLDRMRRQVTTWTAPSGLTDEAWTAIRECPWRGNTRALIRVIETSFVDCATSGDELINADQIQRAMALWEPSEHASHALYTSAGGLTEAEQLRDSH